MEKFVETVKKIFGKKIEIILEEHEEYKIKIANKEFSLNKREFMEIENTVNNKKVDELILFDENTYEVLIDESGPFLRSEEYTLIDEENKIIYKIGKPSKEYIVFIIKKIEELEEKILKRSTLIPSHILERIVNECENIFDVFSVILRRYNVLQIKSDNTVVLNKFRELSSSLLFQFSYNLGISIYEVKHYEELFSNYRMALKRVSVDEIEPPKRKYILDLVYHYQMGLSINHPALQFISFYHIVEHFFNEVFNENIINEVKNEITGPQFSYKRNNDIKKLIKKIKDNLLLDVENNVSKSEINALELTLKKYIRIEKLVEKLNDLNIENCEYYNQNKVSFSDGDIIDFLNSDKNKIFKNIAKRIYKTRNAVIHSKADEKDKYIPFKHERILIKEIPLIKTIAEQIIIETSEII